MENRACHTRTKSHLSFRAECLLSVSDPGTCSRFGIKEFKMFRKINQSIALITFVMLLLTSCAPPANLTVVPTIQTVSTPQAIQTQATSREALVQSVAIQITNTTPEQVNAVVRGNLTESCATLGESQVRYESNTILITVYTVSRSDIGCAQVTTPFETIIALDPNGWSDGTYTVIANGVSAVERSSRTTIVPTRKAPSPLTARSSPPHPSAAWWARGSRTRSAAGSAAPPGRSRSPG